MHEFSLAESLLRAVQDELDTHRPLPGRLKTVRVVVGAMRQVVPDTLGFAYKTLASETEAAGSELVIEPRPLTAECPECGWSGRIRNHLFCCSQCESSKIEVKTGKELFLSSMEFEEE